MPMIVDHSKCNGDAKCVDECPVEAIVIKDKKANIDEDTCIECGACAEVCEEGAITEE